MIDVFRLRQVLNNTGLQIKDPPLYQFLDGLINALGSTNKDVTALQSTTGAVVNQIINNLIVSELDGNSDFEPSLLGVANNQISALASHLIEGLTFNGTQDIYGLNRIVPDGVTYQLNNGVSITLEDYLDIVGTGIFDIEGDAALAIQGSAPINIASINANALVGDTLASNVVFSSLTSTGTVTSGTWSGLFGAISGANLISLTAANLTGIIATAVQDAITRLGTIVSGVWHSTQIAVGYGGTGADLSATGGTSKFLKQASAGATITVVQPTWADIDKSTSSIADITTRSATDLSSGTLADGRLSTNVPLINANNHFTGTGDQTFDGNVKPATTQMMSWNTRLTDGTVYQAASDGLAVMYGHINDANADLSLIGLTDSSNPPTTARAGNWCVGSTTPGNTVANVSFTMPVKKGDYYRFTYSATGSPGPTVSAWWVPLGTAG